MAKLNQHYTIHW